jgi:sulfatase maturation enzyme AslB (radical SAM superfamily)
MRHLEITTYIGCPNRCSYCPQDTLLKAYKGVKVMSLDVLRQILHNTPKDVDIHFSGFSELFFHKEWYEILKEATKEHQVVIYTTTRGLKQEDVSRLAEFNFKQFVVHEIPGAESFTFPFKTERVRVDNPISRGGNLWETGEHQGSCKKQPYPEQFSQNVVLPNGDVYLCCMDYGLKHKIGNLLSSNFNSLSREGSYEICKHCEYYA